MMVVGTIHALTCSMRIYSFLMLFDNAIEQPQTVWKTRKKQFLEYKQENDVTSCIVYYILQKLQAVKLKTKTDTL